MTERYVSDPGSPRVDPDVQQRMDVDVAAMESSTKEYYLDPYEPLQTIYSEQVKLPVKS